MTDTSFFLTKLVAAGLLTSQVAAHGYVQGIVADGVYSQGYQPSFQYQTPQPQVPGWSDPQNTDNGFITDYTSPDIICHLGATPGQTYATVQAGGTVELQWTPWPVGHLGPVLNYLANCNGECTTVDKTQLLFNKINEVGLVQGGSSPGTWAVDQLVANNNSWTLTIPANIAPGNYVLRHEIIALQEAMRVGGAQNYPQCVNLKVTGSGTETLQSGTPGTQLYTSQDPGILIDIYTSLSNYTIPGPPLIAGASNGAGSNATTTQLSPVTSSTTTAVVGVTSTTGLLTSTTSSVAGATSTTGLLTSTTSSVAGATSTTGLLTSTTSSVVGAVSTTGLLTTTTTTTALVFTPPTTTNIATTTTGGDLVFDTTATTFSTSTVATSPQTFTYVGGYGNDRFTVTVTVPGVFTAGPRVRPTALTEMDSPAPWRYTRTGAGFYAYEASTGTAPSAGFAASTGVTSSAFHAYATGTGTAASSGFAASTGVGSAGFIGVPIDNGYPYSNSRRMRSRVARKWRHEE